jgi:hypothetical protein
MKNKKNATTSQTSEGYKSLFSVRKWLCLLREARKFLGYFVWKITILRQKIIFFQQNIHINLTHNIGKAEVQPFCPNREDALYPNRKQWFVSFTCLTCGSIFFVFHFLICLTFKIMC